MFFGTGEGDLLMQLNEGCPSGYVVGFDFETGKFLVERPTIPEYTFCYYGTDEGILWRKELPRRWPPHSDEELSPPRWIEI